jgi:hypothetical protein
LLKTSLAYRQDKAKLYEMQDEEYLEFIRWTFLPIKELTNTVPSIMNICIKQVRKIVDILISKHFY